MTEPGWFFALVPLAVGLLVLGLLARGLASGLWAWVRGPWVPVGAPRPGRALLAGQLRARGEALEGPGGPCVWRQRRFRVVDLQRHQQSGKTVIRDLSRFLDHADEDHAPAELFDGSGAAIAIDLAGVEVEKAEVWVASMPPALFVEQFPAYASQVDPNVARVEIHTSVVPEQRRILVAASITEQADAAPADGEPRRRRSPSLVLRGADDLPLRLVIGTRAGVVLGALVPAAGVLLLGACMLGLGAVGFYERWVEGWLSEGWP
jgi:hypothetical protein